MDARDGARPEAEGGQRLAEDHLDSGERLGLDGVREQSDPVAVQLGYVASESEISERSPDELEQLVS